jgi:hypothetical protein
MADASGGYIFQVAALLRKRHAQRLCAMADVEPLYTAEQLKVPDGFAVRVFFFSARAPSLAAHI